MISKWRRSESSTDWWVRTAEWLLLLGLFAAIVGAVMWRVSGGRWERVESPSMGTVAPVGSLLWVRPLAPDDHLSVGEFITFTPPGKHGVTYSHRIWKVNDDGTFQTKGELPQPDPWRLNRANVVGKVVDVWWGIGWAVRALPVLVIGAITIAGIRRIVSRRWRLPVTLLLGALVLDVCLVIYRPLINAEQLAFAVAPGGGANATYVGTGLLPVKVMAADGEQDTLTAGKVGTVHVNKPDDDGRYRVGLGPDVPLWFWVVLIAVCMVPALYSLVVGLPPVSEGRRRAKNVSRENPDERFDDDSEDSWFDDPDGPWS